MNYDWEHYKNDLRIGKSKVTVTEADIQGAKCIGERFSREHRELLIKIVKNMLCNYRQQCKDKNALIEDVVKQHTLYCGQMEKNEMLKRRHNAIVYRYMMKTALNNKAVAGKLEIRLDSFYRDVKLCIYELLIILFGVPAVADSSSDWIETVKSLFENVRLLKYCTRISQSFICADMEKERTRSVVKTERILKCVEKSLLMYKEYCDKYLIVDCNAERRFEVIQSMYLGEKEISIENIANEQGVSVDTIYDDLRIAVGHFAELFEYMAMCDSVRVEEDGNGMQ